MSNLLRRTSKLRKKKRSKSLSEDEESVELTSSTSHKIMNEIKSHFIKDKSEFRKSKKKSKQTPDEHQSKSDLKYDESIVEAVNPLLPNFEALYTPDSMTFSEFSSNTSDISYGILEDSRDTSTCSSRESLRAEIITDETGLAPDNIFPKKAPLPHPILQKTQSLSRKNSTVNFIRSIFKRSSSEIAPNITSNRILDSEISKSAKNDHKVYHTKSVTLNDTQARTEVKMRRQSFSIKRRLSNLMSETPGSLNRSSSIRDFALKGKSDNVVLWRASLKSLVETDQGVSYNDLSFVNYDVLNTYSYKHSDDENARLNVQLARFYSASTHNVFHEKPKNRYSVPSETLDRYCQSTLDLSYASEAASLPTLHHLEGGDNVPSPGTTHRYRRRLESSPGEDTQPAASVRNGTASSFRSSGSGCSKLRRHNACRQVKRDVTPLPDRNVRSRSLNHLDTLEQTLNRQQSNELTSEAGGTDGGGGGGAALTTDHTASIKDYSRSEPDCTMTRPHQERLLTVPPTDTMPPGTVDRNGSDRTRTTTRRQMLSRSQVSSSEYFSVSFELNEDSSVVHGREEFLPATKGTSLGDALAKVCERRSIDLSICDIYIDGCRYASAHVLNQETSALGGKTIRITGKETSNKKSAAGGNQGNHYRKPSGSYRGKTSSLFFSTSTEDTTCNVLSTSTENRIDFDQNKKQSKQRWSGFFGNNKDTRMESLVDQLNHYSRHGVPNSDKHLLGVDEEVLEALYSLEEDWRQLVDPCNLSERLQQQQTAIWELITTEVAYIKTLRVVTGLFLACLKSLQSCNILTEIDTEKLFSNITEILECNLTFWNTYVYPVVVRMRTNHETISPIQFLDGFVRMRETYHSYFRYCAEQARCQHYCRENHAHNEVFTAYLAWCETQKECNRLRLMDILVRPMQRLTKYGLLLKAIIKNTDDDYEKESLNTMIRCVDDFVNSVNSSLRQKQDNERLRGIMLRIESYDAVETKDDDILAMVQKFNHLDLSQPMPGCPPDRKRHLLLEGDLKLKDSSTSKMEVHCFLLTDILLICKPSSKKGGALMRVIRQPYLVDRLILQELNRETPSLALVYLNEFKTANAAFILQNNDQKKLKSWADSIRKAQGLYEQAKQTPTFGLMRQLSASVPGDEYLEPEYSFEYSIDGDSHSLQSLIPRSPLASSSRASRVSSLAHSHSGSVEMNDQSSLGSTNNQSRGISIENENRTASISSDEGVLPLPTDSKSPINQKNSLKQRLFNASPKSHTPNTLSVQPYGNLGQSLPNLTLGSPNVGTLSLSPNQNTLLVPTTKTGQHLLSPNTRGISYPPPSPTRGNLRRGFAITQSKNPPLLKIGHVNSTAGAICTTITKKEEPTNFDVPVIAGISPPDDLSESFNRGQHRQAMMKRIYRSDNRRYHTAGVVDDIKKNDEKDTSILKRLSWNCGPSDQSTQPEDHTT